MHSAVHPPLERTPFPCPKLVAGTVDGVVTMEVVMRKLFSFVVFLVMWLALPSLAGCAVGGVAHLRRESSDAGVDGRDASWAGGVPDGSSQVLDAGQRVDPVLRETCNGLDDDADGSVDEDFLCPMGRTGEICVTSCGANGYRICEAPSCSWSTSCHPFEEVCDSIDNNCDGRVDEGCPVSEPCAAIAGGSLLRISLDATAGACARGWTIVMWGSGGASEGYYSSPGVPLEIPVSLSWRGRLAMTAYCGDWTGVRNWSALEGVTARLAGVHVTVDERDLSNSTHVCFDPGGLLIRPLIPVECGQPDCPGTHY